MDRIFVSESVDVVVAAVPQNDLHVSLVMRIDLYAAMNNNNINCFILHYVSKRFSFISLSAALPVLLFYDIFKFKAFCFVHFLPTVKI